MANFNELYALTNLVNSEVLFESTADMDNIAVAFIESCREDYIGYMTELAKAESDGDTVYSDGGFGSSAMLDAFNKLEDIIESLPEDEVKENVKKGNIGAAIGIIVAALTAACGAAAIVIKRKKDKELQKKVDELKNEAKELKEKAKDDEISDTEAKSVLKKIKKEMNDLKNKVKELVNKPVKESADDIRLAIYESCYNGEITEEERDTLLSMM